jgi:hypothetical protein
MRSLLLASMAAWGLCFASGCVQPVFHEPTTISTKSIAALKARPLKQVRAESTAVVVLIIPIVPDPRDIYDDLLAEAKNAGGNAVIDVQVRNRSTVFVLPGIFVQKTEAVGTAAVVGAGTTTKPPLRR